MSELVTYSERARDKLEERLAAERNKRELLERHSNGIKVLAYWLMKENICTIYVEDERIPAAAEFVVPNDQVMQWFNHPFAHPDAVFPAYIDDGA